MKIRSGFVSNSSSSSFVCSICGETAEGYDMCIDDAHMIDVGGETICDSHFEEFLKAKGLEKKFQTDIVEKDGEDSCNDYLYGELTGTEFDPYHCLYFVSDDNFIKFLLGKLGLKTRGEAMDQIRSAFKNVKELEAEIKGIKNEV